MNNDNNFFNFDQPGEPYDDNQQNPDKQQQADTHQPSSEPQNQEDYVPSRPTQPQHNGYGPNSEPRQNGYYQQDPYGDPYSYGTPPPSPPNKEPYQWDYNQFESYGKKPEKKKNRGLMVFLAFLVGTLLIGVIAVTTLTISRQTAPAIPQAEGETSLPEDNTPNQDPHGAGTVKTPDENSQSGAPEIIVPPSGELLTIPQVAAKVTPSVVGVMRYEMTLYDATGIGSGFIIAVDDDYTYVMSNAHVVEYGTNFKIRLNDGTDHDAELVGADATADIALLKMKTTEGMVAAEIGDSTQLNVGETVVAIGNPVNFELSGSVTMGIVSALNRKLSDENAINYIQTDAAINPGNSGGALVNMYGQVVGMNTMKVSGTGYEGIGFAIPMADAVPIAQELRDYGKVTSRPVLGIIGKEISESESIRLDAPMGIMIEEVSERAQFEPKALQGDIITHADGERILNLSGLKAVLNKKNVGDEVELTIYRRTDTVNSEEISVKVILVSSE